MIRRILLFVLLVTLVCGVAWADSTTVTLTTVTPTTLSGPAGTSAVFSGTLTNTGSNPLTLGNAYNDSVAVLGWYSDPNGSFSTLFPNASFTGGLVTFTIPNNAPLGYYTEQFSFDFYDPSGFAQFGCDSDTAYVCFNNPDYVDKFVFMTNSVEFSGTVTAGTPAAVTPEPASCIMLGTGIAVLMKRRFRARSK